MSARVLVVDDDRSMTMMLERGLSTIGFTVEARGSGEEAFALLDEADFDVVVTDLNMRGMNGIELCERIVANRPDVPVVVITAFGSMDTAIAAIRAGAYDFMPKPFSLDALRIALDRAVQHRALRDEVKRLRRAVADAAAPAREHGRDDALLGSSAAMRPVYDMLERIGDSDVSVLITGESGTGKELAARALHRRSARRDAPFVAINCAALPENLLESELFGHARGAFTDARASRPGLFARASGGTVFLDEIAELPLALQPKLLRALQERRLRPVGSDQELPFNARLITATNRDLESAVAERTFREELYYRINVLHLQLPPLRARAGDILLLAQHFIERFAAVAKKRITGPSAPAAERLLAYAWPGNVRELQNCIERAVALARYEEITVEDLPDKVRSYKRSPLFVDSDDPSELLPMEEVERRYILRVLDGVAGNKTLAAQILHMDRSTLYRKLERYQAKDEG